MWSRREALPVLFHPVHLNLYGPALESLESLVALETHAREVGSAWVGNDVAWWHGEGEPFPGYLFIPPPFSDAGVEDCVRHALHVQSHLSMPLVLENPAVMCRRGPLHVLDFMAALHRQTGCPLLLDVGHLLSYQLCAGLGAGAGFERFPFEAVVEVHVAGGVITARQGRRFYVDDHTQPIGEELFALLADIIPRCLNLKALTYEGDGHPDGLADRMLARLRPFAPRPSPPLRWVTPETVAQGQLRTDPWALFEEAYGGGDAADDPEGLEVERDFRLAVIAEQLDSRWPLSRLFVAPDRAALHGFTASEAFRDVFEGRTHTLQTAFARFARGKVREMPELAAVLAFETWAQQLARQDATRSPLPLPPGLELCAGVSGGTFAQDLDELLLAKTALRRHLSQRAWGSGVLETSGLSVLRDLARRAPPGPWPVAVRWRGSILETFGLPPAQAPETAWEPLLRAGVVRSSAVV